MSDRAGDLGRWYQRSARRLPWRATRDPYAIWVSEIMLQQTRVDTVVPYYERFMARYGDVRALADAPLEEVLKQWSGLGYYRRARQLVLAAREVVTRYGGRIPTTAEGLQALPGIGRYTAGAIASIAYDEPAPVVDGNVIRVLARLYGYERDMRSAEGQRWAWSRAADLMPLQHPGQHNQALMELGATVCTPRSPRCETCPLQVHCEAYATRRTGELPVLKKKVAPRPWVLVAAVVSSPRAGEVVLGQRREGLYGGMWEPPLVEAADLDAARPLLAELGVCKVGTLLEAGRVRHVLSHRRMQITVSKAQVGRRFGLGSQTNASYQQLAWRRPSEVPLSTLARKILHEADAGRA